jgi:hypothetical protein
MSDSLRMLINSIVFYLCWFASAYGVAWEIPWLGPLLIAGYLLLHWLLIVPSNREMLFIFTGGLMGFGADNFFLFAGVVDYQGGGWSMLAPIWMLFVWFSFLSLFHVSLQWLETRYWLAAVLGGVGGPMSYWWAETIGVFSLGEPFVQSLIFLGATWALITPVILFLSDSDYFSVTVQTA